MANEKNNTVVENYGYWNSGNWNYGNGNSGNHNSGDRNSGYNNYGYWNSGNWNSGNHNSGDRNYGDRNSGNWNYGNWNSGYCNSGDRNSGNHNSGDRNSGYHNYGYRNSGNWNSGNHNSGNWNYGDHNSGYCNSDTPSIIRVFNKDCDIEIWDSSIKPRWMFNIPKTEWIYENGMTDTEKELYPTYKTIGGYLRVYDYKEASIKAWSETTQEDRDLTLTLPNFDAKVFFEIFGIDVEVKDKTINLDEVSTELLIAEIAKRTK